MKRRKGRGYAPTPRVLFNSGFHDGAFELRTFGGESPIRDAAWRSLYPAYTAGYDAGQAWQREGRYVDGKTLSTVARNEYVLSKRLPAAQHAPDCTEDYVDAVEEANAICDAWERERTDEQSPLRP